MKGKPPSYSSASVIRLLLLLLPTVIVSHAEVFLDRLAALTIDLGLTVLLRKLIVLLVKLLALLLEGLEVHLLVSKLLLQLGNLTCITSSGKLLALLGVLVGSLIRAELVLETHDLEDHNVGAVEDERQEEGEAAKVHVTLGVELAGLDFEAVVAHDGSTAVGRVY